MKDAKKHIFFGFVIAFIVGAPAYLDSECLFAGIWASLTAGAGAAVVALFILLMHYAKG